MSKKKKAIIGIIVFIILVAVLQNNKDKESTSTTTTGITPLTSDTGTISCTVDGATNPQIQKGAFFKNAQWNDPSFLKEGNEYIMYASAAEGFTGDIKIYRLTSADAISWKRSPDTPVFEKSKMSGAWDAAHTETPSVVKFNGLYYLFYTAEPNLDPTSWSIGYATSKDGITWERGNEPLLKPTSPKTDPTLDFNQYIVAEPGAIVFNNKIYLYFTAMGADLEVNNTLQTIGIITSSNGTDWSEPELVLAPDQKQYPRSEGWIGYSTPSALVVNDKVHLFFDVANEKPQWKQHKIHHAVSSNGRTGWTQDSSALFSREDFSWTKAEINSPAALYVDGKIKLWFAGHDVEGGKANLAIGMATCDL